MKRSATLFPRPPCFSAVLAVIAAVACWQPVAAQASSQSIASYRADEDSPNLILVDGKVFTADAGHPWAEAVAIHGNKIAAVGTNGAIRRLAGSETRIIDLREHMLVPGLTDAHVHPAPDEGAVTLAFDSHGAGFGKQARCGGKTITQRQIDRGAHQYRRL